MEGSKNIEENNNVTFNKVFSEEPRVRLRSRAESRGDGNKAPLLGTVLGFQRPELLNRGPPSRGQERADITLHQEGLDIILLSEHLPSCWFYLLAFTQVSFERDWKFKKIKGKYFFKRNCLVEYPSKIDRGKGEKNQNRKQAHILTIV